MSHSAKIYKEILNSEQNDNGDHPNIPEKIVDIKSNQSRHGGPKSGPNSDEPIYSCPVEVIGNPDLHSKQHAPQEAKSATGNGPAVNNGLIACDKENRSLNHSVVDDREMPASNGPNLGSKLPFSEGFREKVIDKIMKTLSNNLKKYNKDHKGSVEDINQTNKTFEVYIHGLSDLDLLKMLVEHGEKLEDIDHETHKDDDSVISSEPEDTEDLQLDLKSDMSDTEIKQEEIVMMTNLSSTVSSLIETETKVSKGNSLPYLSKLYLFTYF